LAEVALAAGVGDEGLVRPTQHVDEAGRHGEAACVHFAGGPLGEARADIDDAIAAEADIADIGRAAAAVVDRAAADRDVVARRAIGVEAWPPAQPASASAAVAANNFRLIMGPS
jgi:hypothetical protein